jgi:long-chain acyl-CoA synthetase
MSDTVLDPRATDPRATDPRAQAAAELTGPGGPFEIVTEDVLGEHMAVFARRLPHLRAMLEGSARLGDLGYFTMGDRTLTYADNLRRAASVAAGLRDRYGIAPGDRVAVFSANNPDYATLFWATVSLGAVVTAFNGWWTPDEVDYAMELTTPKVVIGDERRLARVAHLDLGVPVITFETDFEALAHHAPDAALPDVAIGEDDPAVLLFTSGTTGRSKAAIVTHRGLVGFVQVNLCGGAIKARAAAIASGAPPAAPPAGQAVTLLTSPMFHVSGLFAGIILGLVTGGRYVLHEGRFDEEAIQQLIERERVNAWSPVGGLGMRVIEHPSFGRYDLSSLRMIAFGGGPTSPGTRATIQKAFPSIGINMANGYGSSETVAAVSSNSGADYEARPESAGRANPTCEIAIFDERGEPVPDGEEGHIHVRSAYSMLGYWMNPDATAAAFKPGRWLDTGDIGRLEDGMLTINSRARDMIIRGGENVYPLEVERRIDEHPLVVESAVIGVDHDVLGMEVKAIVVPVAGGTVDVAHLEHWCRETLAPYKVPAHWEVRTEPLPRNASGKVLKTELR